MSGQTSPCANAIYDEKNLRLVRSFFQFADLSLSEPIDAQ